MLAHEIPYEQWNLFLEKFNLEHVGHRVRVERHHPEAGVVFEIADCIFEKIHDDVSGACHRIGIVVGEPHCGCETFFMTDPHRLKWLENEPSMLHIEGKDGLSLVVRLLPKTKDAT
jgi:hypothetical protein